MTIPDPEAAPSPYSFDRFFHLSQDLSCIAGFDGYFKHLNAAWTVTLGHTIAALTSSPFMEFVHPEDYERTLAEAARLARGEDVVRFENRYRCADGSYRWLRWACRSDLGEGLVYGSARDVTPERESLARLDALNEELRRQAARLEVSNRELESFSSTVSHDLRAPLRAIDGFSHAIQEHDEPRLSDAGRHALSRVRAAAVRMGVLIDELLELSRLTRSEMYRERVDLSGIAAALVAELRRKNPDRQVIVSIQSGMVVDGDPRMLRIAMQHLVDNAWKYSSRRPEAHIEISHLREEVEPAFRVRDNGVGFDMKYVGKLFEPFQRLHADRHFEGTGIGLATVRRVVQRHGGRIWAESVPDEGATFTFTLGSAAERS
jgi:PAS domain S-box-containing protein